MPIPRGELASTQNYGLGFCPFVVKQHQKICFSQSIQTWPHTQDLSDGNLVTPSKPTVSARHEFCSSVGGIATRRSGQRGIFIRHEANTERTAHVNDLRGAGGGVGTIWCIDRIAVAPGLAVVGGCDGFEGEKSVRFAFEDSHQFRPADCRNPCHTCTRLEVSKSRFA